MVTINSKLINFVRPSAHSTYSPSATDRWMACPFSVKFTANIPEEPSGPWAHEGTIAHAVCEATFRKDYFSIPFPATLLMEMNLLEQKNPGTIEEMHECARGYVEVLTSWLNDQLNIGKILWSGLEKGIPMIAEKGAFGTADAVIVGDKGAVIIDYKHGKGKNVKADTPQLKNYASGVAKHLDNVPEGYRIHAVVYQPRTDFAPKHTCYEYNDLLHFVNVDIANAIAESERDDLQPVEGNHCFWCPASRTKSREHKCPAILGKPLKLAQENFGKFLADMSAPVESLAAQNPKRDAAMIKIMALYPMLKDIAERAKEEFKFRLEEGEAIEGVRLIEKHGNRKLNGTKDKEIADLLVSKFPELDPFKVIPETKKLKTITEIEKEVGKNKLDTLTYKPVTKTVDVLDDKARAILGELSAYADQLNNGGDTEE